MLNAPFPLPLELQLYNVCWFSIFQVKFMSQELWTLYNQAQSYADECLPEGDMLFLQSWSPNYIFGS